MAASSVLLWAFGILYVFTPIRLKRLRIVFEESVDDYLLACKEFNRQPQKPVLENVKKQAIAAG